MDSTESPLTGSPPPEVPLANAPLIRVIAQVRFPLIASVENRSFVAPFQEAIRDDYPTLRPEQSQNVVIGPAGPASVQSSVSWRFSDATSTWRVTLAPEFLALDTRQYTSRDDFLDRFRRVLTELREHVNPGTVDRLGVRYIDRILGESLGALPQLVRPEVAGVMATPLADDAHHMIAETLFQLPEPSSQLMARWGRLPAGSTVDPAAIDPADEPSWILDVDAFTQGTSAFEVETIDLRARALAERIYSFFRWVVTAEFDRTYGGTS